MNPRQRWTLGHGALAIAYCGLAFAALLMPPNRDAAISLAIVGHVLTALVLWRSGSEQSFVSARPRCLVSRGTAVACGAAELIGCGLSIRASEPDFVCWFLLALSFAGAAMIIAGRQEPGDATFTAQLGFHGVMLLPLLSFVAQGVLGRHDVVRGTQSALTGTGPLLRIAVLVGSIVGPALVALVVAAAAINLAQPSGRRRSAWTALLLHEAAFVVILSRWSLALS